MLIIGDVKVSRNDIENLARIIDKVLEALSDEDIEMAKYRLEVVSESINKQLEKERVYSGGNKMESYKW